jgi:hypothetical protein
LKLLKIILSYGRNFSEISDNNNAVFFLTITGKMPVPQWLSTITVAFHNHRQDACATVAFHNHRQDACATVAFNNHRPDACATVTYNKFFFFCAENPCSRDVIIRVSFRLKNSLYSNYIRDELWYRLLWYRLLWYRLLACL